MGVVGPVNACTAYCSLSIATAAWDFVLLAACLLLLLPVLAGDAGRVALRYERAGLACGQWWRLLTATPRSPRLRHALLNSAASCSCGRSSPATTAPRQWLLILLAAARRSTRACGFGDSTVTGTSVPRACCTA